MSDLRRAVSHFANIPAEDIRGMRAPFLQIGGDTMFQMMEENGLEYDCSMPAREQLFPYTLDYHSEQVKIKLLFQQIFLFAVFSHPFPTLNQISGDQVTCYCLLFID